MFRKVLLSLTFCLIAVPFAIAQTGTLTGEVTDSRSGEVLVGVNIFVEELERGAVTNIDGLYSIENIPVGEYNLRITYVGYTVIEEQVTVTEGENVMDYMMVPDLIGLDEMLVTGQQIERQARSLAYSVSRISGEEVARARESNFVDALAGKIPGVDIQSQSGNIGASSRITIRGISSLTGANQPLFVVDGVPISNSNIVEGTSQDRLTGAIDVGNRAGDLNADDIEDITVLRGAAAAALYGQRARNGVILVTTKRGSEARGQTVTVNSSVRFSNPMRLPDFQNEYAQGSIGKYNSDNLNGWGPRIAGQTVENIRGEEITLQDYPDNVRDFYETDLMTSNHISFSNADELSDLRVSLTHTGQSGIVPNNRLDRTAISVNSGRRLTDRLAIRMSGTYTHLDTKGRAVAGANDPNVLTSLINTLPRTFDTSELKDYKEEDGTQRTLGPMTNNPYWLVNENAFENQVRRIFGNVEGRYEATEWLSFTGRAGLDYYTEDRNSRNAVGTLGRDDGDFALDVIQEQQINIDALAEVNRNITDDISFQGVLGYNLNMRENQILRSRGTNLEIPGLENFANTETQSPTNRFQEQRLVGVYGDATFGYRNYLFLNLTGRNDWSSTLPKENRSFFYPSINTSFIFSEAFDIAGRVFSYGKLFVNYAQVGSDEAPYQLDFRFLPIEDIFGQFGTGNDFPFGGRTGFGATGTLPPTDLKPEMQNSFEVGTELQFFDGRAGVDFTWYDVRTEDQIISIPTPLSTGFGANRTNIGEISNKGIELSLNFVPFQTRDFFHNVIVNFHQNRNKVESLAPGVDEIVIASAFNGLQVRAEPGEPLGLYGPGFLRVTDEESEYYDELIINPDNGLRRTGDNIRLGDIDPDFRLSFTNQFNFRGVGVSFQIDYRHGGTIFSQTVGALRRAGVAEETAENRYGTYIDDGVIPDGEGGFMPNNVPVQSMQAFWNQYANSDLHEGNVFSATHVKLREVRVDYTLPQRWLDATYFSSVSIGLEGRNLLLIYSEIPHIDPETGLFGSASNGQGIEWNVLPSVRSFGTNIQVRF